MTLLCNTPEKVKAFQTFVFNMNGTELFEYMGPIMAQRYNIQQEVACIETYEELQAKLTDLVDQITICFIHALGGPFYQVWSENMYQVNELIVNVENDIDSLGDAVTKSPANFAKLVVIEVGKQLGLH